MTTEHSDRIPPLGPETFADAIHTFIAIEGDQSSQRLRSLLLDSADASTRDGRRDVAAIVGAFELGVQTEPLSRWPAIEERLISDSNISTGVAERALRCWAEVLGILYQPPARRRGTYIVGALALVACIVAVGWIAIRAQTGGLLDISDIEPGDCLTEVVAESSRATLLETHDLRVRRVSCAGPHTFEYLGLVGSQTVELIEYTPIAVDNEIVTMPIRSMFELGVTADEAQRRCHLAVGSATGSERSSRVEAAGSFARDLHCFAVSASELVGRTADLAAFDDIKTGDCAATYPGLGQDQFVPADCGDPDALVARAGKPWGDACDSGMYAMTGTVDERRWFCFGGTL